MEIVFLHNVKFPFIEQKTNLSPLAENFEKPQNYVEIDGFLGYNKDTNSERKYEKCLL